MPNKLDNIVREAVLPVRTMQLLSGAQLNRLKSYRPSYAHKGYASEQTTSSLLFKRECPEKTSQNTKEIEEARTQVRVGQLVCFKGFDVEFQGPSVSCRVTCCC